MSITITGGISFSGGVGIVSPPAGATASWFGGGFAPGVRSMVDRITYATDTATATVRGPLSIASFYLSATGTNIYGWYAIGAAGPATSTITRITYANDSATSTLTLMEISA